MLTKFKTLIGFALSIIEIAFLISVLFFWQSYNVLYANFPSTQNIFYILVVACITHLSKNIFKKFIESITTSNNQNKETITEFIDIMGKRFKDVEKIVTENDKQNQMRHTIVCKSIDEINQKLNTYDYEKATKDIIAQKLDKIWLDKKAEIEAISNKYFQSFIEKMAFNIMLFSCGTIIGNLDLKTLQYRLNSINDELRQLPSNVFYKVNDSFSNIWIEKFATLEKCLNNELTLMFDNDAVDLKQLNSKWTHIMESYLINLIDCALIAYKEATK